MTWEEARELSIQKWEGILARLRHQEPLSELLPYVTEACGFCLKALEEQEQVGDRKPVQCPFCQLYVDYGGCQKPLDDLQSLLVNERWEDAEAQIDSLLEDLRRVPLPSE